MPLELFGRKVRDQDAIKAVITTLESRAAHLSQRLHVAGTAVSATTVKSRLNPAAASSHRARASQHANKAQLQEVHAQLRGKKQQLQKLASEMNALLPSLPSCARVPLEIYAVIFDTAYANLLEELKYLSAARLPWLLCAVCSWWRSMARALPTLWMIAHFPIRAASQHDPNLNSYIGKHFLYASPRSHTVSLLLSSQQGAHVCRMRAQAAKYRTYLQRALDRTETILIDVSRFSKFYCCYCEIAYGSGPLEDTIKYRLPSTAVFFTPQYSGPGNLQPGQCFPSAVFRRLRKLVFKNFIPKSTFSHNSWDRAEEVEINSPAAVCSLASIQRVIDSCPALLILYLHCDSLKASNWGIQSNSTLQSLTLNLIRLDGSMGNDLIRLPSLRRLNVTFPDMTYIPATTFDRDLAHTRIVFITNIARHAPQLSALSVSGTPVNGVVSVLKASTYTNRLVSLRIGGTYVNSGLKDELRRTAKAPSHVTFFGNIALLCGDRWSDHLVSLANSAPKVPIEANTIYCIWFDPPVDVRISGVEPT